MKIGLITDSINKTPTGIGIFTKELARNLTILDTSNQYFTIDYKVGKIPNTKQILIKNYYPAFRTYLWHNSLPLAIRNIDLDYVLNMSGCPHLFPFKQKEILFVYDFSWYKYPHTHPASRVLVFKSLIKHTLKNSFKIITISQNTKLDLMQIYNIPEKKITVIHVGIPIINEDEKKPLVSIQKPFLLYIGTIEPRKNIVSIVKAFDMVKKSYGIPHTLIIAGKKGWGYKKIFNLVNTLKIKRDILFLDYVSQAEKKYLYKNADIFIYPSFYEGFGIPPLEAMSYGCPVITSNNSSLPEVVGTAGILVDPYSLSELKNAIIQVLTNTDLKNKMIKAGYKQAKKYTWEISAHKIVQYFK